MHDHLDLVSRIWRIAILRDKPGVEAAHLFETRGFGRQQWHVGKALSGLRQPHLGAPLQDLAGPINDPGDVEKLRWPFRIPPVLVLPRPLHAYRPRHGPRPNASLGRRILMAISAVAARPGEIDQPHLISR